MKIVPIEFSLRASEPQRECRKINKILLSLLCASAFLWQSFLIPVFADDSIDENALFSDTETVIDSSKIVDNTFPGEDKNSLGISCDFSDINLYRITKDNEDNEFASYLVGNIFIDGRIKQGIIF